jgi:hypothetical protein
MLLDKRVLEEPPSEEDLEGLSPTDLPELRFMILRALSKEFVPFIQDEASKMQKMADAVELEPRVGIDKTMLIVHEGPIARRTDFPGTPATCRSVNLPDYNDRMKAFGIKSLLFGYRRPYLFLMKQIVVLVHRREVD